MSDMMFREPNQVKWQGSRPGHNGTKILVGMMIDAINWTVVYTVPAGEVGFITHISLSHQLNLAAGYHVAIYDATPAFAYSLFRSIHILNFPTVRCNLNYWPPLEIPAAFSIRFLQTVDTDMTAHVHGWSE